GTQLLGVDPYRHAAHGERKPCLLKLGVVVVRIDPENVQILRSKTEHLEAHKSHVLDEGKVSCNEFCQLGQALVGLLVNHDPQLQPHPILSQMIEDGHSVVA